MKTYSILKENFQTTIRQPFKIKGKSSLSGKNVTLLFLPAKENTGIIFETEKGKVPVFYKNKRECKIHHNTTKIVSGQARVITTEHILSAVYGMGIDNLIIQMKGSFGIPVFDSSSRKFTEKIDNSGIRKINKTKEIFKIENPLVINSQEGDSKAFILPSNKFIVRMIIDFRGVVGVQTHKFVFEDDDYRKEISSARSFLSKPFSKENWEELRKTIKVLPKNPRNSDIVVYDEKEFLVKLRFKNEQARHKILDFLGDFSLIGKRVLGEFILYKPGHAFNAEIVKRLAKIFEI